jgi:anthranilate phosphoribosyltransferase
MASQPNYVSISDLLKRLSTVESTRNVKAEEVAAALALVFTDALSPVQFGLLLWALHVSEGDHHPKVLTACAKVMREAAAQVDEVQLIDVIKRRGRPEGGYMGGLVLTSTIPDPSTDEIANFGCIV